MRALAGGLIILGACVVVGLILIIVWHGMKDRDPTPASTKRRRLIKDRARELAQQHALGHGGELNLQELGAMNAAEHQLLVDTYRRHSEHVFAAQQRAEATTEQLESLRRRQHATRDALRELRGL
ncbi:hypothetical protein [Nesterenkonia rhizosphaerae]|uniref:Uncharacterized protein n=1 Tax=Nesterenkonia rhizosphaerae TaxID=1348272 RepID=A0ABP9G3R1_9MICC